MAFDRFMIAPINAGLQTDLRPWLIPDDAFERLDNAYVFRGRVVKRFGSRLMGNGSGVTAQLSSRLSINIGTTNPSGNLSVTVPGTVFKVGQLFSIGTEILTVTVTGTPGVLLTTGASVTHTYNTTTGAFVVTGSAASTIAYFYPAEPVMGFSQYQNAAINNLPTYAFDTQFAYVFDVALNRWVRSQSGGNPVFTGDSSQLFWGSNWQGATANTPTMYITNDNADVGTPGGDDMWSFSTTAGWVNLSTATIFNGDGDYVQMARIIVPFKNRLILLNTIEKDISVPTNKQYVMRCRYSHQGSPFSVSAWLEINTTYMANRYSGGGFIDCPTAEAIISAEFIKDRLIVFFERSTWELAYTGNQITPFLWQKLNTELGSESTFSVIPFDKVILAIGNTGVHACNGSNVERIDNKIPDEVFTFFDRSSGVARVCGIRDFFTEMAYWAFPSDAQPSNQPFNTQVLVYNYRNNSWALNDDTITAFGYWEQQPTNLTWAEDSLTWAEDNSTWNSGPNGANFRNVIAGNQEGFVYIVDSEISRNAAARQISRVQLISGFVVLTITDHMYSIGEYISVENCQGITGLSGIYRVTESTTNTVTLPDAMFTGTYTGGGTSSLVSNIVIQSKQWNPYVNQNKNVYLSKIDFCVAKTSDGEITVDYVPSSSNVSLLEGGILTESIVGTNVLETHPYDSVPLEQYQDRLWHPVYFQGEGECIQIILSFDHDQITDENIAWAGFELEAMTLYTSPTSSRMQ